MAGRKMWKVSSRHGWLEYSQVTLLMLTATMHTPKENTSDAVDKGLQVICSGLAQLKVYLGP